MDSVKSVTVHYWAAAKAAAGTAEERLELPGAATLGDLTALVRARHGVGLDQVLAVCSVLIDGVQAGSRDPGSAHLADGATVEFLPPFAGG